MAGMRWAIARTTSSVVLGRKSAVGELQQGVALVLDHRLEDGGPGTGGAGIVDAQLKAKREPRLVGYAHGQGAEIGRSAQHRDTARRWEHFLEQFEPLRIEDIA
jgi:hypothetical protein